MRIRCDLLRKIFSLQYSVPLSPEIVMPEEFLTRLGQALFTVQSIVAFAVFLLASQQEAFHWAGWVTSV